MCAVGLTGAAAQAGFRKPSVLIVHTSPYVADVKAKLNSSGQFAVVDLFSAGSGTPTLAALLAYDAVMLVSDGSFADATTLGNNLADYVDAGGGVVNSVFSLGSVTPPAGRWNQGSGYLVMPVAAQTQDTVQTLDPASITDQNHPILIGVGSFSGGASSFRMNQSTVVAGATIVAKWTGGNVLVAAGPLPGRVDLNFYSPSKDARVDFWDTSTDGVKLMVNSLLYVIRPRVLIAAAEPNTTWNDDVKANIRGTGLIGITDIFRADTGTPTLAQLQTYDAVLVYSDSPGFQNSTAIGNVLADYVDAGGGVVNAVFASSNSNNIFAYRPGGRWINAYELIAGGFGQASTAATLGAVAYPSHPAMAGVASFNGGLSSYRTATSTLNPGAFNIAQWSDGRPLVVASTSFFNRVDLGFFPPSSAVRSDLWQVGTNGDKIMANALLYTVKPYVACVTADPGYVADPVAKLTASRRFSGVADVDASSSTPVAATLKPFNAVMTWSNSFYANSITLGNNLADFVDAGAAVVTSTFANVSVSGSSSFYLSGRWPTQGYDIVPLPLPNFSIGPQAFLGTIVEPAHPVNAFVRKFDGGTASWHAASNPLLRGREILRWSDGRMLASVHNFKKRVDLGFFPASSATDLGSKAWNQRTDGTWLMANALEFAVRSKPCPGDFNGDGFVDDSDFVLFADYYNALLDPRGDLNGDGLTEDSDFALFADGYNALICP
jgi:hypothetical protein